MKVPFFVAAILTGVFSYENNFCYLEVVALCSDGIGSLTVCDAKYGAIDQVEADLQRYANSLLYKSFDLLLLSTYYDNYIKNRIGFDHLFLNMSNKLWEDSIDTIKFITSRGGQMNFHNVEPQALATTVQAELFELHSIARALDIQKMVAQEAGKLHAKVSTLRSVKHDPGVAFYLEEQHIEGHREMVRALSGYVEDVRGIFNSDDAALGRYLYNDYLDGIY